MRTLIVALLALRVAPITPEDFDDAERLPPPGDQCRGNTVRHTRWGRARVRRREPGRAQAD